MSKQDRKGEWKKNDKNMHYAQEVHDRMALNKLNQANKFIRKLHKNEKEDGLPPQPIETSIMFLW